MIFSICRKNLLRLLVVRVRRTRVASAADGRGALTSKRAMSFALSAFCTNNVQIGQ